MLTFSVCDKVPERISNDLIPYQINFDECYKILNDRNRKRVKIEKKDNCSRNCNITDIAAIISVSLQSKIEEIELVLQQQ